MRYDVKKEIYQIIKDNTLSKLEKIQRIKDIYNSEHSGGVTDSDTKEGGGYGHTGSSQNGSGNSSQNGSGNSSQNGSGNSSQNGSGNSSQNGSGNSSQNGSGNSSQNGSGNSSQNGSENSSQNGSGNSSQNGSGNSSQNGSGNSSQNGSGNSSQNGSGNSSQNGSGNSSQNGSGNSSQNGSGNEDQDEVDDNNKTRTKNNQSSNIIPDEYTIGYKLGKMYAEDMYKHGGLKPIMGDIFELPDLDIMRIIESMNESLDDDISAVLDDDSDDDEKTSKIHNLFMNSIENDDDNNVDDTDDDTTYTPDNVIIMRNGAVDYDMPLIGNHVIDRNIGDKIRKEAGIVPKDPDWGLSDDVDSMIKDAFPLINDIYKSYPQDDKEIIETASNIKNKIKGRIRKSREGIIDWKQALREFVSAKSRRYKKGALRKNVYELTGIGLRHRKRDYTNYNKCVVYIDTSGSVNNDETQLIPIMAGEIGKIMQDCHFNTVDIHLFDDSVYNEHFDVDSYTVQDEDWGIEGAAKGGDTNIHSVYRHILNNYVVDAELDSNIDAIIIITDVSGMKYSGNIKPFVSKLGNDVLERMLYVIYNDYSNMYLADVIKEMDSLISKYSQHYEISVEDFQKQILKESIVTMKKIINMNEALGGIKQIRNKKQAQTSSDDRSQEEKEEHLRKLEIQGARSIGRLDAVLPELIANLDKYFPECKSMKEYTAVMSTDNSYYVTEDANVVLHLDINNDNIENFSNACAVIPIVQLIGDVTLEDVDSFVGFPKGFPKEIGGNLKIFYCDNFKTLQNAPQAVSGSVEIYSSNRLFQAEINMYAKSVLKSISTGEDTRTTVINAKKRHIAESFTNKNIDVIVRNRRKLGESFINEAFSNSTTLSSLMGKPSSGNINKIKSAKKKSETIKSNKIKRSNLDIFTKYILPEIDVDWSKVSDKDITIIDNTKTIRKITREPNTFGSLEDKNSPWTYKDPGVEIMVDDNNNMRLAYVFDTDKKNIASKLLFIRDLNNNVYSTDTEKKEFLKKRLDYLMDITNNLGNLGIDPRNITARSKSDNKTYTLEYVALHILYQNLALLLDHGHPKRTYDYNPTDIIDGAYLQSTETETVMSILNRIFGVDNNGDPNYILDTDGKVYPRKYNTRRGSDYCHLNLRQEAYKDGFINMVKKYYKGSVFDFLSDDVLRLLLKGASIRVLDDYKRYTFDQVSRMSRRQLLVGVINLKNVDIYDTILKSQSYSGFRDGRTALGFDSLLLMPDLYAKCYAYRCNVKAEEEKKQDIMTTRHNMIAGSEGYTNPIIADMVSEFDEFERQGVYDDILSGGILNSEYIDKLKSYIKLLSSVDMSDKIAETVKKTLKRIAMSLLSPHGKISITPLKQHINKLGSMYENITGLDPQRVLDIDAEQKVKELSLYPKSSNNKTGSYFKNKTTKPLTNTGKRDVMDDLTEYINNVKSIIENVEFTDDLEDVFVTQENMITKLNKNLDMVSSESLAILNGDDDNVIAQIKPIVNEISNICFKMDNTSDQEELTELIIMLNAKCIEFKMKIKKLGLSSRTNQYAI